MTFKWNPYPDTRPISGTYLVTVCEEGKTFICIYDYKSNGNNERFTICDEQVTAWAELPQSYEKPVRLKAYPIEKSPRNEHIFIISKPTEAWRDIFFLSNCEMLEHKRMGYTHFCKIPEFDFVEE